MTTIAYCRGVMAADSSQTAGGVRTASVKKLHRLSSGAIMGACGSADIRALIPLIDKVRDPRKLPSAAELAATRLDVTALIVFPNGKIMTVSAGPINDDSTQYWGEVTECGIRGIAAVGSGDAFALGAMRAGKSAREAVAIACEFDVYSKQPVDTLKLHE